MIITFTNSMRIGIIRPDGNYYPTYGLKPKSNLVTENFERVYVLETTDNTIDDLIGSINDQIGTQLQPS